MHQPKQTVYITPFLLHDTVLPRSESDASSPTVIKWTTTILAVDNCKVMQPTCTRRPSPSLNFQKPMPDKAEGTASIFRNQKLITTTTTTANNHHHHHHDKPTHLTIPPPRDSLHRRVKQLRKGLRVCGIRKLFAITVFSESLYGTDELISSLI